MTARLPRTLLSLSDDLLLIILDCLPHDSDRRSWRLVCTLFLLLESRHRRSLAVRCRELLLPLVCLRYPLLHRLDLSRCPGVDDRALVLAFSQPGSLPLRALNLSSAFSVTFRGLAAAVRACPLLQEIDVSNCWRLGDREVAAISGAAAGLTSLNMARCLAVTDVGLAKVAVGCPSLQRLNLSCCLGISDTGIDLLAKKCMDLKFLDISYLRITVYSLRQISALRKLEALIVIGCMSIDDKGLEFFNTNHSSLLSIDISRCSGLTASGVLPLIRGNKGLHQIIARHAFPDTSELFLSRLKDMVYLKSLKLDGIRVSSPTLSAISKNCRALTDVGLGKCIGVTDDGVAALVTEKLKTLDLTCCYLVTDNSIIAVANTCHKLTSLKLESCTKITEIGWHKIGTHCTALQELDLTDTFLNDTGLRSLSECSGLESFKLGVCPNVSDEGLAYVGSNCHKLKELDLYRCTGIGDEGIISIAGGCRKLQKLNISYCQGVTDASLMHLCSMQELTDLEIRKLTKITIQGFTAAAKGFCSLAQLEMKHCCGVEDVGFFALARLARNLRQINLMHCLISDVGIFVLVAKLRCLEDVKVAHLPRVTAHGFERALRAGWDRLKKVKLELKFKHLLSPKLLHTLLARGCRIKWIEKPLQLDALID